MRRSMRVDVRALLLSSRFWQAVVAATLLVAAGLVLLVVAVSALLVLLPFALIGALALRFVLRRRLRRRPRQGPAVIEGEYRVLSNR